MRFTFKKISKKQIAALFFSIIVIAGGMWAGIVFFRSNNMPDDLSYIFSNQQKARSNIKSEFFESKEWKELETITPTTTETDQLGRANPFLPPR